MKNISCLAWTAVFLALAAASGWFVHRRVPAPGAALLGAFIGGVILVVTLSWLIGIATRFLEWWLVARARLGAEPRDGKRTAIIGTLRGRGELHSPVTRQRCVLYAYEIMSGARKAYEGFAMVPLLIEHGADRTQVVARPELPGLSAAHPAGTVAEANAKHFIEHASFGGIEDVLRHHGQLRFDLRTEPVVTNFSGCRFVEKVLRPDIEVCAIGTYNAERHTLNEPVAMRMGTAFGIGAAWRVVNATMATAISLLIAVVAIAGFCVTFPADAIEQSHPQTSLAWWEVDLERFVAKNIRTPLVASGVVSSPGYRLQQLCEGCAKGRLEIDGRVIELKHAAYRGGRAVHLSSTANGRDGVTLDGKRVVLTINGKSADVPPSWLQPDDIETSLGEHGDYAGRVTVIAPDRWIRCRVSFNTRVDPEAWLRQ